MLYSMTGYSVETLTLRGALYNLELKSLNSKGFDYIFKSPSLFRNLEIDTKNLVQKNLERGKIECSISYKDSKKGFLAIDEATFVQQYTFLSNIAQKLDSQSDIFSIVVDKYNTMVEVEDLNGEEISIVHNAIQILCDKLIEYRRREGEKTTHDILEWISEIRSHLKAVESIDPKRKEQRREKLLQGIKEFSSSNEIDYNRLGQEVIYYIEKLDISEEISRLTEHLRLFSDTVNMPENTGKKLGFIAQEMGREINTIGSKANDAEMQHIVVDMKDCLEKIKEQLNNVV